MTNRDPNVDPRVLKDPEVWKTGAEPMTAAQRSYLHTLAQEAQKPVDDGLTKAEASKEIEHLQKQTGCGTVSKDTRKRRDPRRPPHR